VPFSAASVVSGHRGAWHITSCVYRGGSIAWGPRAQPPASLLRVPIAHVRHRNRWLQGALLYARRRGWRVNLRPLAERRTLAFVAGLYVMLRWIAWPLLRFLWLVATTPLDDDFFSGGESQRQHQYGGVHQGSHSEGYREF
jgi:hypothetical protein